MCCAGLLAYGVQRVKNVDDTNLIVSECMDVCLLEEFDNVKKLASINKMNINVAKSKEHVYRIPNPVLDTPHLYWIALTEWKILSSSHMYWIALIV